MLLILFWFDVEGICGHPGLVWNMKTCNFQFQYNLDRTLPLKIIVEFEHQPENIFNL